MAVLPGILFPLAAETLRWLPNSAFYSISRPLKWPGKNVRPKPTNIRIYSKFLDVPTLTDLDYPIQTYKFRRLGHVQFFVLDFGWFVVYDFTAH